MGLPFVVSWQQERSVEGCMVSTGWEATRWRSVLCLAGLPGSRLHGRYCQRQLYCRGGNSAVRSSLCQQCEVARDSADYVSAGDPRFGRGGLCTSELYRTVQYRYWGQDPNFGRSQRASKKRHAVEFSCCVSAVTGRALGRAARALLCTELAIQLCTAVVALVV
jgi:hypothetical protein